jgi:hypothetical protein
MRLNGIDVVERHNRPGTMVKVLLRCDFISNGSYVDPYDISSVSLFSKSQNISPSTVLDSSTHLITDTASSSVKWRWIKDAEVFIDPDEYTDADAPYIVKFSTGRYGVVLDGVNRLSTTTLDRLGNTINNSASGAGHYIDIWTVKMTEDSDYQVFVNNVELFSDGFVALTEPVMLKTKTKLSPNVVRLGENVDLKVFTDIALVNRNIDDSIKNMFSQSVVSSPEFHIRKHNEDSNLPACVTVLDGATTGPDIRTTSDNTMVYRFDTSVLSTVADLGSRTGTYSVEATYTILGETIVSPMMYFTVR